MKLKVFQQIKNPNVLKFLSFHLRKRVKCSKREAPIRRVFLLFKVDFRDKLYLAPLTTVSDAV